MDTGKDGAKTPSFQPPFSGLEFLRLRHPNSRSCSWTSVCDFKEPTNLNTLDDIMLFFVRPSPSQAAMSRGTDGWTEDAVSRICGFDGSF